MTKPKPNPRPSSPTASLFGWAGGFVFVKETINLWCKLLSPLGRFYAGVILGFCGDVGVQKKTKGVLLSLFHQRVMKAILTTARHFTTNGAIPSVFACRPQRSLK
jgi:hypothetical protein